MKLMKNRWDHYDMAYVHGDPGLAAKIARELPVCLRLPGPIGHDQAKFLAPVHVVCANGDTLLQLRQTFGDKLRIDELPIGLDSAQFTYANKTVRSQMGWSENEVVIGYVGRMTVLKGVKLLVEAFCNLAAENHSLRLLMVGSGEEEPSLCKMIEQSRLTNLVCFAGNQPHENISNWYRTMDLFVMPSLYENFSNAVLEAMGCGVPVVASRIGGNTMLVTEDVNGWLFEPGDASDLESTLRTATEERKKLPAMGQVARGLVENTYSWKRTAERLEALMLAYVTPK